MQASDLFNKLKTASKIEISYIKKEAYQLNLLQDLEGLVKRLLIAFGYTKLQLKSSARLWEAFEQLRFQVTSLTISNPFPEEWEIFLVGKEVKRNYKLIDKNQYPNGSNGDSVGGAVRFVDDAQTK